MSIVKYEPRPELPQYGNLKTTGTYCYLDTTTYTCKTDGVKYQNGNLIKFVSAVAYGDICDPVIRYNSTYKRLEIGRTLTCIVY